MKNEPLQWVFDIPAGVWTNEKLSAAFISKAERIADKFCLTRAHYQRDIGEDYFGPKRGDLHVHEYGKAIDIGDSSVHDDMKVTTAVEKLANVLASCMQHVEWWTVAPQVRRADGSHYLCGCGEKFPMPTNFGMDDKRKRHLSINPTHAVVFKQLPGNLVGFYGIGFGKLDSVVLSENEDMPVETL